MMKEKNLDDLFREKLLNYEQEPPAYLLENILGGVAKNHRKKRIIWLRVAGVAAALLLAFVAGWQFSTNKTDRIANNSLVNYKNPENPVQSHSTSMPMVSQKIAVNRASKIPAKNEQNLIEQYNKEFSHHSNYNEYSPISVNSGKGPDKLDNNKILSLKPLDKGFIKTEKKEIRLEKAQILKQKIVVEKTIDQQIMEMNKQMLSARSKNSSKARWLLGAQISPEYNGAYSSHSKAYASNMLKTKSNKVDLAGGISIEYKKGKRWSFQSGIYYSGIGQTSGNGSSKEYSYAVNDGANYFSNTTIKVDAASNRYSMNSNAGVVELTQIPAGMTIGASLDDKSYLSNAVVATQNTFIQDFDYLEIPLYLRYNFVDNRFGISIVGGLSSNVLVGNRLYADTSFGKSLVGRTKDLETFNYSSTVGLGFKYCLTNKLSMSIEPRFKYFINSLSNNSSVTYKPYTFGFYTGLSYEF